MKTLDEAIQYRRSVRSYDPAKTVTLTDIERLITAAIEAPSWKNSQTSRYHVVSTKPLLDQLRNCLSEANQTKVKDAPVLLVTTFVKDIVGFDQQGNPVNELANGWGIYDLGLHNAFLLLKAADLGIDSLIMGIRDADAIRHALSIPDNETIVSVIALGHRTADPVRPPRHPLSAITTFH